jgi:hypothetical protein
MHHIFLKSDSEESLFEALEACHLFDPDTHLPRDSSGIRLNVLGTLFERTGLKLVTESGERFPHLRPLPGYYATISGQLSNAELQTLPITERPKEVIQFSF